jgi:hypothetical protein
MPAVFEAPRHIGEKVRDRNYPGYRTGFRENFFERQSAARSVRKLRVLGSRQQAYIGSRY